MKSKISLSKKNIRGFSLVETLVSISILLLALTPALFAAYKSISYSAFSRDQIVAFYLAQEAIEFVRNTRDNNVLGGFAWLDGLDACKAPGNCVIDATAPVASQINSCGGACPILYLTLPVLPDNVRFYNQRDEGDPTIFTREVQITEVGGMIPDQEVIIDVIMRWKWRALDREFSTRTYLLNWQQF